MGKLAFKARLIEKAKMPPNLIITSPLIPEFCFGFVVPRAAGKSAEDSSHSFVTIASVLSDQQAETSLSCCEPGPTLP